MLLRTRLPVYLACLACASAALAQVDGGIFSPTGADLVARYFHAGSALADGTVLISGGLNVSILPPSLISRNELSFYDPSTGTFSTTFFPLDGGPPVVPLLQTARSSHTQTTLPDGRVLIAGGHRNASGTSPGVAFAGVEIFDPWTGVVSAGSAMSAARAMHSATLLTDGTVVIAGGGSWQVFDPSTDSWSASRPLHRTRAAHAAVHLPDDRVLLIGGSGNGSNTLEILDSAIGMATLMTATLPMGLDDLAAAYLADGSVFIAGGQDSATGDTQSATYLYEPVTDVLQAGPDLPNLAGGAADQVLVSMGRYIVLFGGEQELAGVDTVLSYVAIYDSVTHTWVDDGTMLNLHDDFVAVPLDGCSVLLVDGGVPFFGQEIPSATCEVFELTLPDVCRNGDLDGDGDVDLDDYDIFASCLTGPGGMSPGGVCDAADADLDGDVDLADFAAFACPPV